MNLIVIKVIFGVCCVFGEFEKMSQKRRSVILMILNGLMELLC